MGMQGAIGEISTPKHTPTYRHDNNNENNDIFSYNNNNKRAGVRGSDHSAYTRCRSDRAQVNAEV